MVDSGRVPNMDQVQSLDSWLTSPGRPERMLPRLIRKLCRTRSAPADSLDPEAENFEKA